MPDSYEPSTPTRLLVVEVGGKEFSGWVALVALIVAAIGVGVTAWISLVDDGPTPFVGDFTFEYNESRIVPPGTTALDTSASEAPGSAPTQVADGLTIQAFTTVRAAGTTAWQEEVELRPGAEIEILAEVGIDGPDVAENMVIGMGLPEAITLTPGTTVIFNSSFPPPTGLDSESDNIASGGLDIGSYAAGSNGFVRFSATVSDEGFYCGEETLVVEGYARPGDNGTARSEALVRILDHC